MAFPSRKLLSDSPNDSVYELCSSYCDSSNNLAYYCESNCHTYCSTFCPSNLAPSPTSFNPISSHSNNRLIIVIALLATTFVLVSFYAFYVKFYVNQSRRRRRRSLTQERNQPHEEFLEDEHGQIVDHPIWYVNTIGLQPSFIGCITVCKFKKGDGLVDGTECSVCLSEFQEDETLRLLPKCSHAFHVQCIDTWLRAHTNCPMCRAPIVANTATSDGAGDPRAREETRVGIPENGGVNSGGMRGESGELVRSLEQNGMPNSDAEKNGVLPIRRSVSLDDSSTSEIGSAMANATTLELDGNSDVRMEERNDSGSNRSFSSSTSATSTAAPATSGGPYLFGSSSNLL